MAVNIYQEARVLSHWYHALCGNDGINWYTVKPYTVHISAASLWSLCQSMHEVGRPCLFSCCAYFVAGDRDSC